MVVCIALGVDVFRGGPCPPLYIRGGGRVTWKVLAEYSWSPSTIRSGSFLVLQLVLRLIRVVTREVRYIHALSLTLEHSMPISSPAAPGMTKVPASYFESDGELSIAIGFNDLYDLFNMDSLDVGLFRCWTL